MKTNLQNSSLKRRVSGKSSSKATSALQVNRNSENVKVDRLAELKQKLEKQRENMRKSTGRRFKGEPEHSSSIEVQTTESQLKKSGDSKAVSTGVCSSTAANLYDFKSLKSEVEQKNKKAFLKKPAKKTGDMFSGVTIPAPKTLECKKPQKQQSPEKFAMNPAKELQKATINLMELSSVIESERANSPTRINKNSNSPEKFVNLKVQKSSRPENGQNDDMLSASRIFQQSIKEQKVRNHEIEKFLSEVQLDSFSDKFVKMGFDEIETLIEVQAEDLNHIMMRAHQQDRLMAHIREYKRRHNLTAMSQSQVQGLSLANQPTIKSRNIGFRPKSAAGMTTEPSEDFDSSRLRSTTQNFCMQNSTLVSKSSIFYCMGGDQWSLESQIRRACSGCFKNIPPGEESSKRGDCYYCSQCDPGDFDLDISLNESMIRDYVSKGA